ncbi:hypothetical protein [Ulvibacter antarcticus]|nr:hypothetical protein [Ulvibacter antarcticus]
MKGIKAIISTFSEEDKREFLLYLQNKNRRGDTKNVKLFKLIDSEKTTDLEQALYSKSSKNAFHALCKRLQDSLTEFIATKSFSEESGEEMEILKLLLASRILFEHKQYKLAFKILFKAEQIALSLDVYAILNEIYHTMIQYAHVHPELSLTSVFQKSRENTLHFQSEQQLNMAYATIKSALKDATALSVSEIIEGAFSEFDIVVSQSLTYKSLFQLMNITAAAASLQSNYYTISGFMLQMYEIISAKQSKIKTDKHLYYQIEILHMMAMTHFRNKNFKASQVFSEKMEEEMLKKNGIYYKRFHVKLILTKAFGYNYTGRPSEAIQVLNSYERHSPEIELTLLMCYFQQLQFDEAYSLLKKMQHSDIWYEKKQGWIWVLEKAIIEILLLIELDRLDLVLSRLQSFKKKFTKRLKKAGETRVLKFIQLVSLYYENPMEVTSEAFKNKVEGSFEWIGKEREDIFVMSFYAWLKSKMEQTNLYETTLKLAN